MKKDHQTDRGIATIELLIALAVGVVMLTGAVLVSFGGQTAGLDTGLTRAGLSLSSSEFASSSAFAASSLMAFNFIDESDTTYTYSATSSVNSGYPCVWLLEGDASWTSEQNRGFVTNLETFVADLVEAKKNTDCGNIFPPGDWDTPDAYPFPNSVLHSGSQGTDVAIMKRDSKRYALLTTKYNSGGGYTLWILDVTDPSDPGLVTLTGTYAEDDKDLEAIDVDSDYAFLASASTTAQLQVATISDSGGATFFAKRSLPNITNGKARSLYYSPEDQKVYIGTQYVPCVGCTAEKNNELHIFDVDPTNPSQPEWKASIDVDRHVNDVVVQDGFAYLATGSGSASSAYTPLQVYDVRPFEFDGVTPNLTYLSKVDSFTISIQRQGTSIAILGDLLFLGLERGTTGDDFYIIDISDPEDLQEIVSTNLGGKNTKVGDIDTQGDLVFIGLEDAGAQDTFQVWSVFDPTAPWRINTCTGGPSGPASPLPLNLSGMVYSDNLIFAAFRSMDALRVIYDTPALCPAS